MKAVKVTLKNTAEAKIVLARNNDLSRFLAEGKCSHSLFIRYFRTNTCIMPFRRVDRLNCSRKSPVNYVCKYM